MPPKRLRSFPEVPLILSANRFRTGASYFPISSAKVQQKNDISKFLPSEMSLKLSFWIIQVNLFDRFLTSPLVQLRYRPSPRGG